MELTGIDFAFGWELGLMEWIQAHLGRFGMTLMTVFSAIGEETAMIALIGLIYWGLNKELGRRIGLNAVTANCSNTILKNVLLRRRPYFDHETIRCLKPVVNTADIYDIAAQGYSFPSLHSTNAAAGYGTLATWKTENRRLRVFLRVISVALPLLIGISRFSVGVHYPTDVLAGLLIGLLAVLIVPRLEKLCRSDNVLSAVLILLFMPGVFFAKTEDFFSMYGLLIGFGASIPFERQFVRFENTRCPLRVILRVAGGAAVFFALNTLLKLPFPEALLEADTLGSHMIRCARYAVTGFVLMALYPAVFRYTAKIGRTK